MKRWMLMGALVAAGVSAQARPEVGVSVQINQPGVYGRVDVGRVPTPPMLMYPQPVIVAPPAVVVQRQPIYLHVPPGHSRHWHKHCHRYNACGQQVYFVQNDWYQQHYHPNAYGRDDRRGEHRDWDDGHRGRGHGHGHGHGRHRD